MIYQNVLEAIGHTPIIKLNKMKEKGCADILVKFEGLNVGGSIKTRTGVNMITDAEQKGLINKDTLIIEPTSGNTGIGLASIAASKGYRLIITMPETMSVERRKLISAYGAELVLTDGSKGMNGAIQKAEELSKEIPNSIVVHLNYNKHELTWMHCDK